jgi:hypothetical protein
MNSSTMAHENQDEEPSGEVTTVWASGEVVRTKTNGTHVDRESVPAIRKEDAS